MSFRNRLSFPVLLAAALMLAAAPANAGSSHKHDRHESRHYSKDYGKHHGKHYDKHHRKHYRKHHGKHYSKHQRKHYGKHYSKHQRKHHKAKHYRKHDYKKHGKHYGHRGYYGHRPHVARHAYGYPVYDYGYDTGAYYCGPCNHYFDSYDRLSHHVHGHHGVAVLALPSVILQASIGGGIGWAFGY
jgi:hypothetical protein